MVAIVLAVVVAAIVVPSVWLTRTGQYSIFIYLVTFQDTHPQAKVRRR